MCKTSVCPMQQRGLSGGFYKFKAIIQVLTTCTVHMKCVQERTLGEIEDFVHNALINKAWGVSQKMDLEVKTGKNKLQQLVRGLALYCKKIWSIFDPNFQEGAGLKHKKVKISSSCQKKVCLIKKVVFLHKNISFWEIWAIKLIFRGLLAQKPKKNQNFYFILAKIA